MKCIFPIFWLILLSSTPLYSQGEDTASPSRKSHNQTSLNSYSYQIIKAYPHDREAFTQGLVYADGAFYEGTGLYGKSSLRKVEPETGNVLQMIRLPERVFGEGIAAYENKIVQLTWKSGFGFIYDRHNLKLLAKFDYPFEGWGITYDGKHFITSDGTSIIRFFDPETFDIICQVQVHDKNGPVIHLNELEYINGEIYANIWQTDKIARIAPDTGQVTGCIDLKGLFTREGPTRPVGVLNGIAYDSEKGRLFVTGKLWPKLFEIKVIPMGREG